MYAGITAITEPAVKSRLDKSVPSGQRETILFGSTVIRLLMDTLEGGRASRFSELALVLVRLNHVASGILNANHGISERLKNFASPIASSG